MGEVVDTLYEIIQAIGSAKKSLLNYRPTCTPPIFYTAGTMIPDELAVEYYKHTDQYVITRDGTMWKRGEKINEAEQYS